MSKALKIITTIIGIIVIILIAAAVILTKVVDPNDYKNKLDSYVYQQTGHHMQIQSIALSYMPWLGIDVKGATLSNPQGFKGAPLASVAEIKIKLRFWSLLAGKISVGQVLIHQANINLLTQANGNNNWRTLGSQDKQTKPSHSASTSASKQDRQVDPKNAVVANKEAKASDDWSIDGIDLTHSALHIRNQQTHSHIDITQLNIVTGSIAAQKTFPAQLKFILKTNPQQRIETQFNTNVSLSHNKLLFKEIKLVSQVKRRNLPTLPVQLEGNLAVDMAQESLLASPLKLQIANMPVSGKLQIQELLNTPSINAHLLANQVDLQALLTTLRGRSFISGQLSFDTVINTHGSTQQQCLQQLNGSGRFTVNRGAILGFNINQVLQQADAILNKKITAKHLKQLSNMQTSFNSLSGSFIIRHGVLINNDLRLDGGEIDANGQGRVDLANNRIDYRLTSSYSKQNQQSALSVPILIQGRLDAPRIQPDFAGLAKKVLSNEIKSNLKKYGGEISKKLRLDKLFH